MTPLSWSDDVDYPSSKQETDMTMPITREPDHDHAELRDLSLEEMEQVSGGEENGVEYFAAYIAWRCQTIYKGPLR
jgi:hypothetical protein